MNSKHGHRRAGSKFICGPQANKCAHREQSLSERETIRLAQEGDASAFEHIYQLHSSRVYALCLRMVRNPAEAEDLTQETFLLVFRKLPTFRGESAFSTWLHRLAVNVVLMSLRKRQVPLDELENQETPGIEAMATFTDTHLTGVADRITLMRAMVRLSPPQRAVFVLHDVQGFNHVEIAGMMDYSVGTTKAYLHRARRQLRKLLRAANIMFRAPASASTNLLPN
jgi:RNA polymerase sigma-70 factor (ECF subfamily)